MGFAFKFFLTIYLSVYLGQSVDTIVMNPPFGTRKKGADMDFLSMSLKVFIWTDFGTASHMYHCDSIFSRSIQSVDLSIF